MNAVGPYRLAHFDEAPSDVQQDFLSFMADWGNLTRAGDWDDKHWQEWASNALDCGDERLAVTP